MTLLGIFTILINLIIAAWMSMFRWIKSSSMPVLLFFYHLAFAIVNWRLSFIKPYDSWDYYRFAQMSDAAFGVNTNFIIWISQKIYWLLEPSYLDMFLLFQMPGFVGICMLYQVIQELVTVELKRYQRNAINLLFFLPGLHFWTSFYGKDSLMFFGIVSVIWSFMRIRKRYLYAVAGLVVVLLVRPHIAAIMLFAIAVALYWGKETPLHWKGMATIFIAGAFIIVLPILMKMSGLTSLDPESIDSYIDKSGGRFAGTSAGVNVSRYSFPVQIFTYLYRPLFYDAFSGLAYLASVENLIWVFLTIVTVNRALIHVVRKNTKSFFILFNLAFAAIGVSIMAKITSNLGISLRQKTMFLPSIAIIVLLTSIERKRKVVKGLEDSSPAQGDGAPFP